MNAGQYKAELAMSRLVSKELCSRAIGIAMKKINSTVHSTIPVQHKCICLHYICLTKAKVLLPTLP